MIISFYSDDYGVLISSTFFGFILYWSFFIPNNKALEINLDKVILSYVFSALFCATGVIVQYFAYSLFGIEIFRVDNFLGRTAFSFLWLDYSYISLFITSAIPFLMGRKGYLYKVIGVVLFIGSILTSARTGIVSLFLAYMVFYSLDAVKGFFRGEVNIRSGALIIFVSLVLLLLPFIWAHLSDRELTFNSSGRIEGYLDYFYLFSDKPIFGLNFMIEKYSSLMGAIPHNLFVYFLVFGGVIGFSLFFTWFSVLILNSLSSSSVQYNISILVVAFGLQFVPSMFSAYFIAFLFSLRRLYILKA